MHPTSITLAGSRALKRLEKHIQAAQDALLAPLSAKDRRELERLMARLVEHHRRSQ